MINNLEGPLLLLFEYLGGADVSPQYIAVRFFAVFVIILIIFPIHESAHAYMAKYLGDDTAERAGRLTLFPLAHIDFLGAFFMLIAPFGGAKPVPVDPNRCDKVKPNVATALISAAGPLSNMVLGLVFVILAKVAYHALPAASNENFYYITLGMFLIAQLSVFLGMFNLIPLMPLDGAKILFLFLPQRAVEFLLMNDRVIRIIFMFLLFFTNVITNILSILTNGVLFGMDFITGFLGRLM